MAGMLVLVLCVSLLGSVLSRWSMNAFSENDGRRFITLVAAQDVVDVIYPSPTQAVEN